MAGLLDWIEGLLDSDTGIMDGSGTGTPTLPGDTYIPLGPGDIVLDNGYILRAPRSEFTVVVTSLLGPGDVIAELPVRNLRFSSIYKDSGTCDFIVTLGDTRYTDLDLPNATLPRRTAVWINFQGVPVWGGILWKRQWNARNNALAISAGSFESFYEKTEIIDTMRFDQVDQLQIVRTIIQAVNARQGGDINLILDNSVMSGVLRDRSYFWYDQKNVFEAIKQLSNVIGGFDFAIDVGWNGTTYEKFLALDYPYRGSLAPNPGLLFDTPGNITDYDWIEDGWATATEVNATGSGDKDSMLIAYAINQELLDAGYPRLIETRAYSDIITPSVLQDHADDDLNRLTPEFNGGSFTVSAFTQPGFGDYIIGDFARFLINDDFHTTNPDGSAGFDDVLRILGWDVDAANGLVKLDAKPYLTAFLPGEEDGGGGDG